jgi:hypothetical protein
MGASRHACKRTIAVTFLGVLTALVAPTLAWAPTFTSSGPPIVITGIAPLSAGAPYPSTIAVSGVTGTVTKVTVTFNDLDKPTISVRDWDFLLVSPIGKTLILLSDAGEGERRAP